MFANLNTSLVKRCAPYCPRQCSGCRRQLRQPDIDISTSLPNTPLHATTSAATTSHRSWHTKKALSDALYLCISQWMFSPQSLLNIGGAFTKTKKWVGRASLFLTFLSCVVSLKLWKKTTEFLYCKLLSVFWRKTSIPGQKDSVQKVLLIYELKN